MVPELKNKASVQFLCQAFHVKQPEIWNGHAIEMEKGWEIPLNFCGSDSMS